MTSASCYVVLGCPVCQEISVCPYNGYVSLESSNVMCYRCGCDLAKNTTRLETLEYHIASEKSHQALSKLEGIKGPENSPEYMEAKSARDIAVANIHNIEEDPIKRELWEDIKQDFIDAGCMLFPQTEVFVDDISSNSSSDELDVNSPNWYVRLKFREAREKENAIEKLWNWM